MTKELKSFSISPELLELVDARAGKDDVSVAEVIRRALAEYLDYDLSKETITRKRHSKYATEEEKKSAQKAQRNARNEVIKELWKKHKEAEKAAAIKAMEESLAAKNKENNHPTTTVKISFKDKAK